MDLQSPLGKKNKISTQCFKVMLKLPLKHSPPPVNTVQIWWVQQVQAARPNRPSIKFCKILGNTGWRHRLSEASTNAVFNDELTHEAKKEKLKRTLVFFNLDPIFTGFCVGLSHENNFLHRRSAEWERWSLQRQNMLQCNHSSIYVH